MSAAHCKLHDTQCLLHTVSYLLDYELNQAEATFLHHVYFYGGARHVCYNCIAASGAAGNAFN